MKRITFTIKRCCASVLCAFALSAQAATWQFKDTVVTVVDFDGSPLSPPVAPYSITGRFAEKDGVITFWDIVAGPGVLGAEFTSLPGRCFMPPVHNDQEPCREIATAPSPMSLRFQVQNSPNASGGHTLTLELTAPLGSGADTIRLVPGQTALPRGGPLLQQGSFYSKVASCRVSAW